MSILEAFLAPFGNFYAEVFAWKVDFTRRREQLFGQSWTDEIRATDASLDLASAPTVRWSDIRLPESQPC